MSISTRALAWGLSVALTTSVVTFSMQHAATAAPYSLSAPMVQSGYTDSAQPNTAFDSQPHVNMPIGARDDAAGVRHKSRVYVTYDLAPLAGKRFIGAVVRFTEAEVADCSKRAIEIRQVKRALTATPAWNSAPVTGDVLADVGPTTFCPTNLSFEVSVAVQRAIARGESKISFEIRVPARHEADPSYRRAVYWSSSFRMTVEYNSVPVLDQQHRYAGGFLCDTTVPYRELQRFRLEGMVSDADDFDQVRLITEFAVWPVNNPDSKRIYTDEDGLSGRVSGVDVPPADVIDGVTYAWQYRGSDGLDTTAWSQPCYFVVDSTQPTTPGVTSPNYPRYDAGEYAPLGEPGVFTFDAAGDTDTIGFEWAYDTFPVPACQLNGNVGQLVCPEPLDEPNTVAVGSNGSATVQILPKWSGENRLKVRAIDGAGNRSGETEYRFLAPFEGRPSITVQGPEPEWNQEVTIRFASYPGLPSQTTQFVYRLDGGPEQSLVPGADGTATVTFQASNPSGHRISVRSHSANGWVSQEASWSVDFDQWPGVTSDVYVATGEPVGGVGVPGTFTFSPPPGLTEILGYQYSFNFGEPVFIAAGPDGRASFVWIPEVSGFTDLEVYPVRPDGSLVWPSNFYTFNVA